VLLEKPEKGGEGTNENIIDGMRRETPCTCCADCEGFVIFRCDLVGGRTKFFLINARTIFGMIVRSDFEVEERGRGKKCIR
jgi:hypothetical protein